VAGRYPQCCWNLANMNQGERIMALQQKIAAFADKRKEVIKGIKLGMLPLQAAGSKLAALDEECAQVEEELKSELRLRGAGC